MPKETKFTWLMHQIYDHGKEIHRYRLDNRLVGVKSNDRRGNAVGVDINTLECAIDCFEGMVGDGTDEECYQELDQVINYNYYKGYWKALLWVMNMSLRKEN